MPEALAYALGLIEAREPLFHGQLVAAGLAVLLNRAPDFDDAQLVADTQPAQPNQPGPGVQGRGQARACERLVALLTVQEVNARAVLKGEPVEAADLLQEGNRVAVTTHEEVLAVIHDVAGLLVREGIGPPAEVAAPFERDDREAALAQLDARRQPGEPAADNHNGSCGHTRFSLLLNQMSSAIFSRRFFGTASRLRNTSNCTPVICSSISR